LFYCLFFSIYFYQERVFFSDTSFQFFKILNFEKFNIEAARYSVFFTQAPLLLLVKSGLTTNIQTLSIVFSVTFLTIYYGLFLLIDKGLKDNVTATILLAVFVISISRSFYHTVTETHQAVIYTIGLYAFYKHQFKRPILNYVIPIFFIALALYAHIVAIVFVPFVLIFYHIHYNKKINARIIISIALLFILGLIKILFIKTSTYQDSFLLNVLKTDQIFLNIINSSSLRFINAHLFNTYFIHIFLFIFNIVFLIKRKKKKESIFFIAYTIIALLTLLIVYNKVEGPMMKERALMPLGIVLAVPFFTYLYEDKNIKKWVYYIAATILLFATIKIFIAGEVFSKRTEKVHQLINYASNYNTNDKFIINDILLTNKFDLAPSKYNWSYPFETLLISTTEKNFHQITILGVHTKNIEKLTRKTNVFLGPDFWPVFPIKDINKKFFDLKSEHYIELK
jgi:hypothetical protein